MCKIQLIEEETLVKLMFNFHLIKQFLYCSSFLNTESFTKNLLYCLGIFASEQIVIILFLKVLQALD